MSKFFVAFSGRADEAQKEVYKISEHLTIWNLATFDRPKLVEALQKEIPILPHLDTTEHFNLDFIPQKTPITWGIMVNDSHWDSRIEQSTFVELCNLFSQNILYPLFSVDDLGIMPHRWAPLKGHKEHIYYMQNYYHLFASERFSGFYELLKSEACYMEWYVDNVKEWVAEKNKKQQPEHWRLFIASSLFRSLRDYDYGKKPYMYLKEVVDITVVFEMLLTNKAETSDLQEKLMARSAFLLDSCVPNVKDGIKEMYEKRCSFVHGSYFVDIWKHAELHKDEDYQMPMPEFDNLKRYRNYLRLGLLAYLFINRELREGRAPKPKMPNALAYIKACISANNSDLSLEISKKLKALFDLVII